MKIEKKVSIVVPIYNVEKYLDECVRSLINQTYKNIEIILVDDGSKDSSGAIADNLAKEDSRIRVIHKDNGGVSSARNLGIKNATGDYICFVDSDDYLAPEFVEYMIRMIQKNDADFCFSKNCFISDTEEQVKVDKVEKISSARATSLLLSPYIEVGCWNKMYKTELIKSNNILFSEDLFYGEGLDFICRVAQEAKTIVVCEKKYYYYRKNNLDSATTKFNYNKFLNGEKSLIKIKNEIKYRNRELDLSWNLHYVLFSINALIAIYNNKGELSNFKIEKKIWHDRLKKFGRNILLEKNILLKYKIKYILAMYVPNILAKRNIRLKRININKSV